MPLDGVHRQESLSWFGQFYAYCKCGICGPIRNERQHAERDRVEHAEVCSARKAAR